MTSRIYARIGVVLVVVALVQCASAQQYDAATEAVIERGRQANSAGQYEAAVKAFREANKLQRNTCSLCYRGLAAAYAGMGNMSDADSNAKKAISTARDAQERVGARLRAGIVLMAFSGANPKRLPAAEAEFRQALAEAPEDVQARYQLGIALLRQKKDEEGLKHLAVVAAAPAGDLSTNARLLIANPRRAREWFAPQFEATTLQGETVSLAALSGKVVVLDFWATWCPPCRASVPELKGLLKKYPREKLVLISISADKDEDTCRKFVAEKNMDWPQIFDADHVLIDRFNVNAFPTYLVIDGEGVVKKKIAGMDPQQSVAARIKDTLQGMKELN